MKTTLSDVRKLRITEIDNLDPITVILEDFEPGRGKIIIECFGESWTAGWYAMGDRTIAEFFISCDNYYLGNKLSRMSPKINDEEALVPDAKKSILTMRLEGEIDSATARDLYDRVCAYDGCGHEFMADHNLLYEVYGDDWHHCIPQTTNPRWEYLCRIIDAVRDALRTVDIYSKLW